LEKREMDELIESEIYKERRSSLEDRTKYLGEVSRCSGRSRKRICWGE
jgi:hypothetical protein